MVRLETPIASDDLLKEYVQTGCPRAFEKIVFEHWALVLAICTRITGNAHDAEDGTQAVFLTLALQARGGNAIHSLRPWLAQVARHVSLDLCKARRRRLNHEQAAGREPDLLIAASPLDQEEMQRLMREQIDALPPRYRTPMILFYFGGMTLPAMGRQLGISSKALGVRLLRARRMLAERLARMNYPWIAVAIVPALTAEAVQSGLLQIPAASTSSSNRLFASLAPALLHMNLGISPRRHLMLGLAIITVLTGVAGSASVVWEQRLFPQMSLPGVVEWVSKTVQRLPRFSVPSFSLVESPASDPVPATPEPTQKSPVIRPHAGIVSVSPVRPLNVPPPARFASSAPVHIDGPQLDLSWTLPGGSLGLSSQSARKHLTSIDPEVSRPKHYAPSGVVAGRRRSPDLHKPELSELEAVIATASESIVETSPQYTINRDGLLSGLAVTGSSYDDAILTGTYSNVSVFISSVGSVNLSVDSGTAGTNDSIGGTSGNSSVGVPEPTAVGILVVAAGILVRRRRRV